MGLFSLVITPNKEVFMNKRYTKLLPVQDVMFIVAQSVLSLTLSCGKLCARSSPWSLAFTLFLLSDKSQISFKANKYCM